MGPGKLDERTRQDGHTKAAGGERSDEGEVVRLYGDRRVNAGLPERGID